MSSLRVLVTGGAGFIGSNLAHKLVELGHRVAILDNFHPAYGGNDRNLFEIQNNIELIRGDILDQNLMTKLVQDSDVVYHIAAQCSHVDSLTDPWFDLEVNCKGTLCVLEAARQSPKKPVIIYAGTRATIGAPLELPASETTLPNPTDIYGVNKLAAELYGSVYARVHRIPFVTLRLTNCYGPRHQMKSGKYGILNWFVSLALQNKPIKIFGTGEQLRDYLYIDDAIEAFIKTTHFAFDLREEKKSWPLVQLSGSQVPFAVIHIGSGKGLRFVDCARKITEKTKSPLEFVSWPQDRKAIETGDYVSDGKAAEEVLNWVPQVTFDDGLEKTIQFYSKNLSYYKI